MAKMAEQVRQEWCPVLASSTRSLIGKWTRWRKQVNVAQALDHTLHIR